MRHAEGMSFERRVFETLYGSSDFDEGINNSLDLIGREFHISRVYIFENSDSNRYGDNTYEWCAPGITPQINELQHMSYEEYGYDKLFAENGAFICPDTSKLPPLQRELLESQGIRATLQCAILDQDIFCGFVGFDDCQSLRRDWMEGGKELDALRFLSRLLTVYLIKDRNLRRATRYQKKMEQALEAAEKASKAKSDFLSRMSHDIRTPLNGIIGMTEIVKQDNRDPALEHNLETIASSSRFLLSLINDILDISKIESGKLTLKEKPVPLTEFDDMIGSVIKPLMNAKNIRFIYEMRCGMDCACIDRVRFNQVFFNLLSNAAKFTQEGGQVEFLAERLWADEEKEWVRFIVRDNGIGMKPDFVKHAFDAFEQDAEQNEKLQNQGTGLGLAITKQLVELMGGTVTVKSVPGQGSEFTVDVPLKRAELPQATAKSQNGGQLGGLLRGRRVLLVEDNRVNTLVAKRLLEAKGMEVAVAENGKLAVERFMATAPGEYDAVLMDVRMPVMGGLEATRQIRQCAHPDSGLIPIIAMTANAFDEDVEACLRAGMNAHLAKPVEPERLYETLAEYVGERAAGK